MPRRVVLLLIIALGAFAARSAAPALSLVDVVRPIEVRAKPITVFDPGHPSQLRFGRLEFRGGLELTSGDKGFGGLSALRLGPDGRHFLSLSDKGQWLRGEIRYDGARPTGIANAEMAPMLDWNGGQLAKRGWYDSEALAVDGDSVFVGFERVHRIARFAFGKDGLKAHAKEVPTPAQMRKLPSNKGIEGLIFVPHSMPLGGTLIAFSERGLDAEGNLLAFLVGGPAPGIFKLRRHDEYDISDAEVLPPGDVLLLERKFSWTDGIRIRIRRIALAQIRPDALVDGPVIFEADTRDQVDNMEGLAQHRSGADTVLTMVSDDNFSPLQRTLLLQFTLKDD